MARRSDNPVVLVIEDDPPVRELIADVLDEIDFEVVAASDGGAALQIMSTLRIDLITLDLDLPGLTGSELLHVIHSRTVQAPPVIVISSTAPISRELQSKVQAVVTKPFDVDDLIATVRKLLPHPEGT
jgi:two-component system KDP operon response regulator KdpE